jgi:hypothetical protein
VAVIFRLKDHVISLVAVFLSLGVGILIGTGMSDDMMVKQQRLLIEQMAREHRVIREEKVMLEKQFELTLRDLDFWQEYQNALYPRLVNGSLADMKVAIICYGTEIPQDITVLLQDAGAIFSGIIFVHSGVDPGDSVTVLGSALAAITTGDPLSGDQQEILDRQLLAETVQVRHRAHEKPDAVIWLLGDRQNTNSGLVKKVLQELQSRKIQLVALEKSEVTDSLLNEIRDFDISTIDNGDTIFGQFSLLSVLQGNTGHFGFKDTAEQFVATF